MMVVRWSRENGRIKAISGGSDLDARRVDVLPANLECDTGQRPARRAGGRRPGAEIEESVMARAVEDALVRLRDDRARQVRALLAVGHQVALRQAHEHAVVQL